MTFHSPLAEWRVKVASQQTTRCLKQGLQGPSLLKLSTQNVIDS